MENEENTFPKLLKKVKTINFNESREDTDNFLEFVCKASEFKRLILVFEGHFGPPVKPAGKESKDLYKKITEPFGGILTNQTLYYRMKGRAIEIAMVWPWQSGELVTVKIVQFTSQPLEVGKSPWKQIKGFFHR